MADNADRPRTRSRRGQEEAQNASAKLKQQGRSGGADGGGAPPDGRVHYDTPLLTADDVYLFNEGSHFRLFDKLGAQRAQRQGVAGTHFAVWAPNAQYVAVIGDFNGWDKGRHPLRPLHSSGIWFGFIPGAQPGTRYKYHVASRFHGYSADKADPVGFLQETPPASGSIIWDLAYDWGDDAWLAERAGRNALDRPMSIYEVHLGSWMHEAPGRSYGYRELAPRLAEYATRCGFTHVEFLPVMEHPFYGSWGYQTTGYFAPTSRFGSPQDLMYLIDYLHQHDIGVILDWVPSHFPTDEHGLGYFDGTHLFEHADPREGFHPDWKSYIFNYGRNEVRSFLISSALFWLEKFHADGLRVDAVASMLYRDYSRTAGEWIPNEYGGRENLEAISFLRRMNEEIYRAHPDVQVFAEESTAWPMVSRPTWVGGLGFGAKWDMGWMHDTLAYMGHDPVHRSYHHGQLTFRMVYAFHENFVLPLSHDEVVHGKGSLIGKMAGDPWQRFANLRLLYGYMYAQPGKKLLFMGGEFGQWREWDHDTELEWQLLEEPAHASLRAWVADLNRLYRQEAGLHRDDVNPSGFEWVDANDAANSTLSFLRKSGQAGEEILVVCNFTPVLREQFRVGVPRAGRWHELLNSDAALYGGSGAGNLGGVEADAEPFHGRPCSLSLTLPPLAVLFFRSPPVERAEVEGPQPHVPARAPGSFEARDDAGSHAG
jgi:1,4-alpha-glucan branching enzyme